MKRDWPLVLPIMVAALAIRAHQLGWGLPFVYEEGVPLKKAWEMWRWGSPAGIDLNPHFFHYPSLVFYLQFLGQGLLYLVMRLFGVVGSGVDFSARYLVDPTPFYLVGRSLSVLFGVGTVWLTYLTGRRLAGRFCGAVAAALLAVNTYHIGRSQQIEVDVPLTFFTMLALWLVLRLRERPSLRAAILAGFAIGFATATKYTGALLMLPLAVAYWAVADRRLGLRAWYPLLSLVAAMLVFLLTSPYVVLDSATFAKDMTYERQHMRLGHFGLDGSSSWAFYGASLTGTLLGWPATTLAAAGLIYLGWRRRRPESLALIVFAIACPLAFSAWRMHADRYLLPVLPVLLILVGVACSVAGRLRVGPGRPGRWGPLVAGALALAAAMPKIADYPAYAKSITADARSEAAAWIEANVAWGSFLVSELYGPELYSPQVTLKVQTKIREKVQELRDGKPFYASLPIPFFQVMSERSKVFYDLGLYANADYIITTGAVRSRYEADPALYGDQLAFYRQLETVYAKVAEFAPDGCGGSTITIYRNPAHHEPFAARAAFAPLQRIRIDQGVATGSEDLFYFEMGILFEAFERLPEAIGSYDMAFSYGSQRPAVFQNLVMRKVHCLLLQGRKETAATFLEAAIAHAPTPDARKHLRAMSVQRRD